MKRNNYTVYMPDIRQPADLATLANVKAWVIGRYQRGEAWIIVKGKRVVIAGKA